MYYVLATCLSTMCLICCSLQKFANIQLADIHCYSSQPTCQQFRACLGSAESAIPIFIECDPWSNYHPAPKPLTFYKKPRQPAHWFNVPVFRIDTALLRGLRSAFIPAPKFTGRGMKKIRQFHQRRGLVCDV